MATQTAPSLRVDPVRRRPVSAGAILAVAALLSAGLAPVLAAEPSAPAPEAAISASILIVSLDTRGTDSTDDDVLVDGSTFSVRLDDGDRAFDASLDAVADGPTPAPGGLLDTALLGPGWYWVETVAADGYEASPPILVELNTDGTKTCVWDAGGLTECQANDAGAEGLSWTMVLVRNAPSATPTAAPTPAPTAAPTDPTTAPTGAVEGETGRPAVTLPPTDRVNVGREPAPTPGVAGVVILLLLIAAMAVAIASSTRAAAVRRSGPHLH